MLLEKSRLREARNDTLIQEAPELTLATLARLYALPWLRSEPVTIEAQRKFMRAALYGARSTYSGFFSAVRGLFSYGEETLSLTLTIDSSGAYLSGAGLSDRWAQDRFIELEYVDFDTVRMHRSSHIDGTDVYLWQTDATSHHPASQVVASSQVITRQVIATLLPFRLLEPTPKRPCEVILELDEEILIEIPPSYFRENGDARTTDPQGLQMMEIDNPNIPISGDRVNGPFPLYYPDDTSVSEYLRNLLDDLLAAGVKLTARRRRF